MTQFVIRNAGLTLIELIVTIAIVGILTAIGIPSYNYYIQTANRSQAKSSLQQIRGLEEQFYTNTKVYTSDLTKLGFSNSPLYIDKNGQGLAANSLAAKYKISVDTTNLKYCAAGCEYEIVATAQNNQVNDKSGDCAILWFNSLGQKGSAKLNGTDTTSTANCW